MKPRQPVLATRCQVRQLRGDIVTHLEDERFAMTQQTTSSIPEEVVSYSSCIELTLRTLTNRGENELRPLVSSLLSEELNMGLSPTPKR